MFIFAIGVSTGTVTITILSDTEDEFDETFELDLVDPSGGTIGTTNQMIITILDDDDVVPTTPGGSGPNLIGGKYYVFASCNDSIKRSTIIKPFL